MPRRPRPLSSDDGPLAVFALELRALRDSCGPTAPTPGDISAKEGIHRTTIYAALAAKQVPSPDVLAAMVKYWNGNQPEWATKRSMLANALSAARQVQEQQRLEAEVAHRAVPATRHEIGLTWEQLIRRGITVVDLPGEGYALAYEPRPPQALRDFGKDLRELIYGNGLSIKQLAELTPLLGSVRASRRTLSETAAGHRLPDWETLAAVIKIIAPEDLYTWQRRWIQLREA